MYQSTGAYQQSYNKNMQYPLVGANNYGYVQATNLQQQQQMYYAPGMGQYGIQRAPKNQMMATNPGPKVPPRSGPVGPYQKTNGYQLKVGGVVVGSWANGSRNTQAARMNRAGMVSKSWRFLDHHLIKSVFRFVIQSINVHHGVWTIAIVLLALEVYCLVDSIKKASLNAS